MTGSDATAGWSRTCLRQHSSRALPPSIRLWRHASKRLLPPSQTSLNKEEAAQITKQYRFGPVLYLGALVLSFASEGWSIALCQLLPMVFALWDKLFKGVAAMVKVCRLGSNCPRLAGMTVPSAIITS